MLTPKKKKPITNNFVNRPASSSKETPAYKKAIANKQKADYARKSADQKAANIAKAKADRERAFPTKGTTPPKQKLSPAAKPKTGMDALKALGKYITTFGFATEGYNPAPNKKVTTPKQKLGGSIKSKKK